MEKKRKLPARAAARVEQVAKKRNITPRERSETPATPQPVEPPGPPPPPPLPKSIQAGKPLPTVEDAQPDDLSAKEYQSMSESGVLAESLARSRNRWISEGLFEKYWTKPHKRKGVVTEDPKNPPKDSMTKVGNITITVEPHVIEATMYTVKKPKAPLQPAQLPHQPQSQTTPQGLSQPPIRPIIQYGPPSGSMPPPPIPSATATPTMAPVTPTTAAASPAPNPAQPSPKPQPIPPVESPKPVVPPATNNTAPALSPSFPPRPPAPPAATPPLARPQSNPPQASAAGNGSTASPSPGAAKPATTPGGKPAPNDPVIALLAQKASGDVRLRDLMKRVAVGQAKEGELARFQKIIDNLNAEYKRSGGQQGPSAERLLVDGRTVKYFAEEVRTILDIVLASNPNQKSAELRPPPRSDALVVLLVKTALEDPKTKALITRIASGQPGFTDATDLKEILDRLHRDAKITPKASPAPVQLTANGMPNGLAKPATPHGAIAHGNLNPQALRSKGPPPAPKPDISAVVFDFGNGDRYMFPKFSVLEYLPTPSGQQVVASFLIVRKGSMSEYGGDPDLDYYQPVTIRLYTHTGRVLENLARVVAPQDEVGRYMDDVMDNMTRAEYVLLAMRLPRTVKDAEKDDGSDEPKTNGSTPKPGVEQEALPAPKPAVLWTHTASKTARPSDLAHQMKPRDLEQESQHKYQRLVNSVAAKDLETI